MDITSLLAAFGLLFLVLGLGFYLNFHSWRSIQANYEWLAAEFGLHLRGAESKSFGLFRAPPYLSGVWDGREMSMQTVTAGLSNSRHAETAVNLQTDLNPEILLFIQSRRGLNRLERSEFKGLQVMGVTTLGFDPKIRVLTNNKEWLSSTVTDEFYQKLSQELGQTSGSLLLVKGAITYRETGLLSGRKSLDRIYRMTLFLGWCADHLGKTVKK